MSKTDMLLLSCPLQAYRLTRKISTDNVANVQTNVVMSLDKVQKGCGEDEKDTIQMKDVGRGFLKNSFLLELNFKGERSPLLEVRGIASQTENRTLRQVLRQGRAGLIPENERWLACLKRKLAWTKAEILKRCHTLLGHRSFGKGPGFCSKIDGKLLAEIRHS